MAPSRARWSPNRGSFEGCTNGWGGTAGAPHACHCHIADIDRQIGRNGPGQSPSSLPSPGQRPGNRGSGLSGGLKARPLAALRQFRTPKFHKWPGRWPSTVFLPPSPSPLGWARQTGGPLALVAGIIDYTLATPATGNASPIAWLVFTRDAVLGSRTRGGPGPWSPRNPADIRVEKRASTRAALPAAAPTRPPRRAARSRAAGTRAVPSRPWCWTRGRGRRGAGHLALHPDRQGAHRA